MPRRAGWRVCNVSGCPNFTDRAGRCTDCRREAEQRRGSASARGYGKEHRERFRPDVLARDPVCRCEGCDSCTAPRQRCARASQHADHWPLDRHQLVAAGHDPNDPARGRGLCQRCHSSHTARAQPGGWNQ